MQRHAVQLPARTVGAGVAALGAVAAWPSGASAAEAASDISILDFALALEYLQASFYTEAERIGALHGALKQQADVVGTHERLMSRRSRGCSGPTRSRNRSSTSTA